jgi:hypothetical protein
MLFRPLPSEQVSVVSRPSVRSLAASVFPKWQSRLTTKFLRLISESLSMHGIRAEDGFRLCSLFPPDSPTTTSVAFAFQTGEVWCTDTDFLRYGQTIPFVEPVYIERLSKPSIITLKPAIRYQFKTGQRDWPKT